MNFKRVRTITLHSWYHLNHSVETWVDLFWFSTIQIIVFGLMATYFIQTGNTANAQIILLGLVLWGVIVVGQYSVTIGALWEIWSKSFSNLFITPLTLTEFVTGHMIGGFFKASAVFLITSLLTIPLFDFSIFSLGPLLILFFLELIIFSWSAGMFIFGLILRFGTNIASLGWGLIYIVQPLAAVFYPLEVLPRSIRWLSFTFPVTYIFETARHLLTTREVLWAYILYASVLNIIYFILSYWFMNKMLIRGKRTGAFARMES